MGDIAVLIAKLITTFQLSSGDTKKYKGFCTNVTNAHTHTHAWKEFHYLSVPAFGQWKIKIQLL